MSNVLGEPFKQYVQNQIKVRQTAHGSGTSENRTPDQLAYLNSKTAWVKLASGIKIGSKFKNSLFKGQGTSVAKKYVLFNGVSSLSGGALNNRGTSDGNNIWSPSSGVYNVNPTNSNSGEFGLVPMPGITDISINSVNNGSIRSADVNIKCYSPEQFKILDAIYLRVGYTMLLEWGWSLYLDNNGDVNPLNKTLLEDPDGFFAEKWKNDSYVGFLPKIEYYRSKYNGNYDGFLCKVSNFNWTLNQDGSYDITLQLVSLGNVIESLKCNVIPPSNVLKYISDAYKLYSEDQDLPESGSASQSKKNPPSPVNNYISSYFFTQKIYLTSTGSGNEDYYSTAKDCPSTFSAEKTDIPVRTKFIKLPPSPLKLYNSNPAYSVSYYSNARKDQILNDLKSQNEISITKITPDPSGDGGYIFYSKKFKSNQDNEDFVYFNYNSLSDESDQRVSSQGLYVRLGHFLDFLQTQIIFKIKTTGKDLPIIEIDTNERTNRMYTLPYQVSLDPRVCIVRNDKEPINSKKYHIKLPQWKVDNKDYARIMNIYLNCDLIESILKQKQDEKGDIMLFDLLDEICKNLNKALGGINNLELRIDEDSNTIRIVDTSYSSTLNPNFNLILYGYQGNQSNFVKDFNLKTSIDSNFATKATIGSVANGYSKGTENTMFSKWNKGLVDVFKENVETGGKRNKTESSKKDPADSYVLEFWNKTFAAFGLTAPQDIPTTDSTITDACALDKDIIEKNIEVGTEFYKYCFSKLQEAYAEYSSPSNGFIPISLNITFEGISGIKIGNGVPIITSFLPSRYSNSLKFLITKINHKVSDEGWTTETETQVISQNLDKNGKPILSYDKIKSIIKKIIQTTNKKIKAEAAGLPPELTTPPLASIPAFVAPADNVSYSGPGYDPLKKLIFSGESVSYDTMAPVTTYQKKFGVLSTTQTISKVSSTATGAVGRYQNLPRYLTSRAQKAGLDPLTALFSEANQEKMGEGLIDDAIGPYIKGTKSGTKEELIKYIQAFGRVWASLPVVTNNQGVTVGNIDTGAGLYTRNGVTTAGGYYVDPGNGYGVIKGKTLKEVVQAILKARKNISNKKPDYVPSYIDWNSL
jgi:hypothetical protein